MIVFLSAAIIAILFVILLVRVDGDLILMWKEKFGYKIESLNGQVVWITGASSGIGESIAYILAQAGCRLVLSARRSEELERVKATCLKLGRGRLQEDSVLVLPLDVVDYQSHPQAVERVLDHFKQIDILINNAGKTQFARWVDIDLEVDRTLFEINVLGPVSLTQCVLPHMIARRKGHVSVVSSLAGKFAVPGMRSYTTSKHALHGSFECLRSEVAEHNVDVSVICPGPVFSNLYMHAATSKPDELLGRKMSPTDKRMSSERCAHLCCVAIANGMYETWIAEQPALASVYFFQYLPSLGTWFMAKFGAKRAQAAREGK